MEESKIRRYVRDRHAGIARQGSSCCVPESGFAVAAAGAIRSIRVFGVKPAVREIRSVAAGRVTE